MEVTLLKKILERYLLGLAIISAFFFMVYVAFPPLRNHIVASNEVLDIATAMLFVITFIIGLYYSRWVDAQHYRIVYLLVSLISFVGFFSEVRLGFHPLIKDELIHLGITNWSQMIVIMCIGIGIATMMLIQYLRKLPDVANWIQYNIPTVIFLMGFMVFFLASIWLDNHNVWGKRSIIFAEELCEVDMAASLFFCVIYLRSIISVIMDTSFTTPAPA